MVKTVGSSSSEQEIIKLVYQAKQEIERLSNQPQLFISESDTMVKQVFSALNISSIGTAGLEIIFGKIYDNIGINTVKEDLFRHLQ